MCPSQVVELDKNKPRDGWLVACLAGVDGGRGWRGKTWRSGIGKRGKGSLSPLPFAIFLLLPSPFSACPTG